MNTYKLNKEVVWQTRDEMDKPTNPLQSLRESLTRTSKDMVNVNLMLGYMELLLDGMTNHIKNLL